MLSMIQNHGCLGMKVVQVPMSLTWMVWLGPERRPWAHWDERWVMMRIDYAVMERDMGR